MRHVVHEFAGKGPYVFQFGCVFWRDNEPKMMAVLFASLGKGISVNEIGSRTEQACILAIAADAIAFEIGYMVREGRRAETNALVANDTRLDDDAPVASA
jgi:hypothetical protein